MNKRIFIIDNDCFIIYTGLSSSDEKSFLRIGGSGDLDRKIQKHIGYIVIPDAQKVDYAKEIKDIRYMDKGRIRYICNKENQQILFTKLEELGVNESDLFHKDLSKDLDNISRIDNKKHFFTVFYENKNVKIVSDDEVFFELFNNEYKTGSTDDSLQRLTAFIDTLEKLRLENADRKNLELIASYPLTDEFQAKKCSLFLLQEKVYIPLNPKMFRVTRISELKVRFVCNSSVRFMIGREIRIAVVVDGKEDLVLKGMIDAGEVIESEVLYQYFFDIRVKNEGELTKLLSIYAQLLQKAAV